LGTVVSFMAPIIILNCPTPKGAHPIKSRLTGGNRGK
jgi:hypothetical protein